MAGRISIRLQILKSEIAFFGHTKRTGRKRRSEMRLMNMESALEKRLYQDQKRRVFASGGLSNYRIDPYPQPMPC